MAVLNTSNGHVVATPAIGKGPDSTRYDAGRHLVFSPNGEDAPLPSSGRTRPTATRRSSDFD